MPSYTPKLRIPKPTGNEFFTSESYKEVLDAIEQNASPSFDQFNMYKSNRDSDGIYLQVDYKRTNGTLFMRSTLSNDYTLVTCTYYNDAGTATVLTKQRNITYDNDGNIVSMEAV